MMRCGYFRYLYTTWNYTVFKLVKRSHGDYTACMNKTEVLTLRIEKEVGTRLSEISKELGLTRAEYLRMVLKLASTIDTKELMLAWKTDLKQQMLHQ